ncbi:MAG: hypothetical protein JSW55_05065 [Chloroflexota bacterium]|nr:MAG: hypothetical protein JSW55_05065 [Chloroflexota bacterium]
MTIEDAARFRIYDVSCDQRMDMIGVGIAGIIRVQSEAYLGPEVDNDIVRPEAELKKLAERFARRGAWARIEEWA